MKSQITKYSIDYLVGVRFIEPVSGRINPTPTLKNALGKCVIRLNF